MKPIDPRGRRSRFFLPELPTKKLNFLSFFVSVGDVSTDTTGESVNPMPSHSVPSAKANPYRVK